MITKDQELRALLSRIQQRDQRAMGDFYHLARPALISFIVRIVRDVTTAEEVLQDTLCHVWVNAAAYREERGALTAWVYLIARSRALDALRRGRRLPFTQPLEDCRLSTPPLDTAAEQLLRWRKTNLERNLQELPAAHRRLIHLAFFEGHSHREIAVAMNLPLGTVKSRIRAAVSRLREGIGFSGVNFHPQPHIASQVRT